MIISRQDEPKWADSLTPKDKKAYIKVAIDEYQSLLLILKKAGKNPSPDLLKKVRIWSERQRRLLKLLGSKKHLPSIGKKIKT